MEIKACRHILNDMAEEFAEITTDAGDEYSLCADCYIKGIENFGKDPSEVIGYHVYRSESKLAQGSMDQAHARANPHDEIHRSPSSNRQSVLLLRHGR